MSDRMVRRRMTILIGPEVYPMLVKLAEECERSKSKTIDLLIKQAYERMIHNKPFVDKDELLRRKIDDL